MTVFRQRQRGQGGLRSSTRLGVRRPRLKEPIRLLFVERWRRRDQLETGSSVKSAGTQATIRTLAVLPF